MRFQLCAVAALALIIPLSAAAFNFAATGPKPVPELSFLDGAGMTIPGELARVTGLSRPDAGLGNRALVAEGYATMIAPGTYRLAAAALQRGEEAAAVEPTLAPDQASEETYRNA